jgi:hypothetical protein
MEIAVQEFLAAEARERAREAQRAADSRTRGEQLEGAAEAAAGGEQLGGAAAEPETAATEILSG